MPWWGGPMGGWGYALMGFGSLALWALLLIAVVVGVRAVRRDRPAADERTSPQQLLAERYARGEIDEDEYHRRLDTLTHGHT
ncbi:SHOCT domain-containing protein [Pseudonocardia xishanensis]|uniref:SHOCT domain-containing protein n=1 Tax=Pseudonocardia xishanensis TaxID=630995 RepID=A0ABP8RQ85_9PSEU